MSGLIEYISSCFFNKDLPPPPEPPGIFEKIFHPVKALIISKRSVIYEPIPNSDEIVSGPFLRLSDTLKLPEYLLNPVSNFLAFITIADVFMFIFYMIGTYMCYQFWRNYYTEAVQVDMNIIGEKTLEKEINSVSSLIEKMHDSHTFVTKKMWELQVPLTMVKYRMKMMDQIYADAATGDAKLAIEQID